MIVFTSCDNRFTRFVERSAWRLAGVTVCRVVGHRHSRYIWGMCNRCCQTGWKRLPPLTPEQRARSPRIAVRLPVNLVDSAWEHYTHGASMPQAEAVEVWRLFNNLGDDDERVGKIVTLGRWLDREAHDGVRCAVCAGVDGSHDEC